jgi:hypothetical protein
MVVVLIFWSKNVPLLFTNSFTLFMDSSTVKGAYFFGRGRGNSTSTQRGFPPGSCFEVSNRIMLRA